MGRSDATTAERRVPDVFVAGEAGDPGECNGSRDVVSISVLRVPNEHIPTYPGMLGNPFRMGKSGRDEEYRAAVITAHAAWVTARNVPAMNFMQRRGGLLAAVPAIEPSGGNGRRVGSEAWEAVSCIAARHRGVRCIRLACTRECREHARSGGGCHAFALAHALREVFSRRA